jgi:hypothetical protein
MKNADIADPVFREAVDAIDAGKLSLLSDLLATYPQLVAMRNDLPVEGYFKHPYLLWFIADNPIRHDKLPPNISEIARLLISQIREHAAESFQEQIDYAFGLVASGRIARECGVQINLMELLMDKGAVVGDGHDALANGNIEAARWIIEKSGKLTLTAAVCLDRFDDVKRLLMEATAADMQVALIAAAFFGKSGMIKLLVESGADVNGYIEKGFHVHGSALHQAVASGSLDAVKMLVEAGANLEAVDRMYDGTPLGWAQYMQTEQDSEADKKKYREIETYLISKNGKPD